MISITIIYTLLIIIYFKFKLYNLNIIKKLRLKEIKYKKYTISLYLIVIILSTIIFSGSYIILFKYFKNIIIAIILSLILSIIPIYVFYVLNYLNKEKIIKSFPMFAINLKNYVKIDNNIIVAFDKVKLDDNLKDYINKFNISVKKGINIYDCFETLKKEINISRINNFLTMMQFCYINGGNFEKLLDKYITQELEINIKKEKEKQKSFSSKIMLIMLITLSIFLTFGVIMKNPEYYKLYTETIIGKSIMTLNIISYIVIIYMYFKINKMEE